MLNYKKLFNNIMTKQQHSIDPKLQARINKMFEETGIRPAFIKKACYIPTVICTANNTNELHEILFCPNGETRTESEEELEMFLAAREVFKLSAESFESLTDPREIYSIYEVATKIQLSKHFREKIFSRYIQYETDIEELKSWGNQIETFPGLVSLYEERLFNLYQKLVEKNFSLEKAKNLYHNSPEIKKIKLFLRVKFFDLFKEKVEKMKTPEEILSVGESWIEREASGHDVYERDKNLSDFYRVIDINITSLCSKALEEAVTFEDLVPVWYATGQLGPKHPVSLKTEKKMAHLWGIKLKRVRNLDTVIKLYEQPDPTWDVLWDMSYKRWGQIFDTYSTKADTKEALVALCKKMPVVNYDTYADPSDTFYDWEEYKLAFVRKLASFYKIPS